MTIIDQPITASPGRADASTRGHLVGVEHEYVLRRGSERVDARRTVDLTRFASPALDPGDPNARRVAWGGVVTFDGPELEVVTPPATTGPGFATKVAADCDRGRRDLEEFLPDGLFLEGFSAHLNVSVTPGREVTAAKRFIATFSAAMMLLLDGVDSPGILVRPRPGRLEIGGEFQEGQALVTALVFATGATRCCDVPRRQWNHSTRHQLATLVPKVDRAVERFGWFIDRAAFGGDLYHDGRNAILPVQSGDTITAQAHLESSWHQAHLALENDLNDTERNLVDDVIQGRLPLPSETPLVVTERHSSTSLTRSIKPTSTEVERSRSPFGSLIAPRTRGSLCLTAEVVTWGFVVFTLTDGTRTCHLTVPGPELEGFLDRLDDGALDTELRHRLDRPRRTKLARASQTGSVDAYRDLPNPGALLPPERNPGTGRFPRGSGGGGITGGRPGKRQQNELQPPTRPKWVRPVVIGAVGLVVVAVIAAALASGSDDKPTLAAAGSTTATPGRPSTSGPEKVADYGEWESTAGTISLVRRGDRLIGTVTRALPAIPGSPGCQLRVGQQLFSVTAEPPSNVGTTPKYEQGTLRVFTGIGTGTLQRYIGPSGTLNCAEEVTPDVPLFLLSDGTGSSTPGSSIINPTFVISDHRDVNAAQGVGDWFPIGYWFAQIPPKSGRSATASTVAAPGTAQQLPPAKALPNPGGS